jgi:hypothetical protein
MMTIMMMMMIMMMMITGKYFANIFIHYRPTEGWEPLPI